MTDATDIFLQGVAVGFFAGLVALAGLQLWMRRNSGK